MSREAVHIILLISDQLVCQKRVAEQFYVILHRVSPCVKDKSLKMVHVCCGMAAVNHSCSMCCHMMLWMLPHPASINWWKCNWQQADTTSVVCITFTHYCIYCNFEFHSLLTFKPRIALLLPAALSFAECFTNTEILKWAEILRWGQWMELLTQRTPGRASFWLALLSILTDLMGPFN